MDENARLRSVLGHARQCIVREYPARPQMGTKQALLDKIDAALASGRADIDALVEMGVDAYYKFNVATEEEAKRNLVPPPPPAQGEEEWPSVEDAKLRIENEVELTTNKDDQLARDIIVVMRELGRLTAENAAIRARIAP